MSTTKNAPSVEYRADHPSGMPWLAFDGTVGTATGKRFCLGVYPTAEEAWDALGMLPVVVDHVAYDAEGVDGLAWDCPMCGVGGTNPGGEDDHNRYAHRAVLEWDADHHGGTWLVTPVNAWDGLEGDLALNAAFQNPGIRFAMACTCHLYDGWNDETQVHQYGCGESFATAADSTPTPDLRWTED